MKLKKCAYIGTRNCVACGECAFICPKRAISIVNGCFSSVNQEICIGCGICSKHCPTGCITIKERQV